MKNLALLGRRELVAHRRFVTGVTASVPAYKEVDEVGNKEWVVDVYIGPMDVAEPNVAFNVPVAPYARQVVGDIRQPVLLERSKQGKYTVIGRAKELPAGAQMPEGSILEPTYHRIEHNLTQLRSLFIADITWTLQGWDVEPWDEGPWQEIRGEDAFGNVVVGSEIPAEDVPPQISTETEGEKKARHVVLTLRSWGNPQDPGGFRWGIDPWMASYQKIVELTE
jgi:hypothetical protein